MDSELDWISHEELARLTGAHRTTVRRWKRQARATGQLPRWLAVLVSVYRGFLGAVHPTWTGWLINRRGGELVSPDGVCVTQGQILALPYLRALLREREAELSRLRAALDSAQAAQQQVDPASEHGAHQQRARVVERRRVPEAGEFLTLRVAHHHATAHP